MGTMGYGYGSEWHLLRYLGRHRGAFDQAVCDACQSSWVRWKDQPHDGAERFLDGEFEGVGFLDPAHPAASAWTRHWPQGGSAPCWDAIGVVNCGGEECWLLVEAKAHAAEMRSACQAVDRGGRPLIRDRLMETKRYVLGEQSVEQECPGTSEQAIAAWIDGYYQLCNRLAVLRFLRLHGVRARLLFVYFHGDRRPSGPCPQTAEEWDVHLNAAYEQLGLAGGFGPLSPFVHKLFLPVSPHRPTHPLVAATYHRPQPGAG